MSLGRITRVVVDASALGEYLLGTDLGVQVGSVIEGPDVQLNVPAVCDVELCSAIRLLVAEALIDEARASQMLMAYVELPIERHGHLPLLGRILELRDHFSAPDAVYVALCEQLGGTLITGDDGLTRATREHLSLNVIGVTG